MPISVTLTAKEYELILDLLDESKEVNIVAADLYDKLCSFDPNDVHADE